MKIFRLIFGPILALIFLSVFVYMIYGIQKTQYFLGSVSDVLPEENTVLALSGEIELNINAESAILIETDLNNKDKIVFEKAGDKPLPIASLTKLMTAVIVLDNYKLSDIITISKEADSQFPLKQDIKLGDKITVENLLKIMLVGSSNRSAYALSEGVNGLFGEKKFVEMMNVKANSIGLMNTFFKDPTGLSSENISTARDLAKLAKYILKNYPKIAEISSSEYINVPILGKIENTDQLLGEVSEVIFSKTGYTIDANGCLILVTDDPTNNSYVINIVLGAEDRFLEMKKMINWSQKIWN